MKNHINKNILKIEPCIQHEKSKIHFNLDFKSIKAVIEKTILKNSNYQILTKKDRPLQNFLQSIPLISFSNLENISKTFSFTIICSAKDFDVIENFISKILHKKFRQNYSLEILEKHSFLFKLSNLPSCKFYIIEYSINLPEKKDLLSLKKFLFYLKLFISFIWKIRNVHFIKGDISPNQPIFKEIYELILLFNKDFIDKQGITCINAILDISYFLKNKLSSLIKKNKTLRHILLEMIDLQDKNPSNPKLKILLCINILKETERFGKIHIMNAVKNCFSNIKFIEESFIENKSDNVNTLFFFEIEKKDKKFFNAEEKNFLKEKLKIEIENSIEYTTPHIFIQKNEEEILKNVVLLSNQLKYVKDIPQVIISYEKQTSSDLIFSVILLRVLQKDSISIEKSFLYSDTHLHFIPDDIKIVGYLKKYKKEANIFKLSIKKEFFYRKDFSLDSQKARIKVSSDLEKVIGKFRDYNGSLIKQQKDAFHNFKNILEKKIKNSIKTEKFFYSIKPIIMQTVLESNILKKMFHLILQIKITKNFVLKTLSTKDYFLIAIGAANKSFQEPINAMINQLKISSFDITSCQLNIENSFISGYIIKYQNTKNSPFLYSKFLNAMHTWQKQIHSFDQLNTEMNNLLSIFSNFSQSFQKEEKKQLKISLQNDPLTMDPRKSGDIFSSAILFMLFSGLTEFKEDGSISLNLAKNIKISKDKKTYIFYLKDNIKWSDGTEITAYDFEKSWKKILDPDFASPCKYLLNPILNAEKASEGKISVENTGIKSINAKILEVNLTHPAPYFLSITSFCSLFPIPKRMENLKNFSINKMVNNGPFLLKKWVKNKEIILEKNPLYWNAKKTTLDYIHISIIKNEKKNLQMFEKGKIDWAGSLISPLPNDILNIKNSLNVKKQELVGGTTFCFFNLNKFPFNNTYIRKAFGLAINRKKIVKKINLSSDQIATRCIPPIIMNNKNLYLIKDNDIKNAKLFFEKGLKELNMPKEKLNITLSCKNDQIDKIQAKILKETWEKSFNIKINIQYIKPIDFYNELNKNNTQLSLDYWSIQYPDPMNILERFKNKKNVKNYSNWENKQYQILLKKAKYSKNKKEREKIIEESEKLFIENMPISPIYHHKDLMMIKSNVKGIFIGPLGEIYFNKAYFN